MIPASAAGNRIRPGTVALFARRKEQHHILYGNEMTLLLTSGSSHTISLKNTLPHTGGAGPTKTPQAPPHRGGGDEAKQNDQTGKATRSNKTSTHLTGKRGYHGVGGEGVCGSPASYMCVYVCIYMFCVSIYTGIVVAPRWALSICCSLSFLWNGWMVCLV